MEWFEGTKQQWYLFRNGINKNFDTKKTNINIVYSYIHVVHSTQCSCTTLLHSIDIDSLLVTSQQEKFEKRSRTLNHWPPPASHKFMFVTPNESVRIHRYQQIKIDSCVSVPALKQPLVSLQSPTTYPLLSVSQSLSQIKLIYLDHVGSLSLLVWH